MRILIDTNIFIHLEDDKEIESNFSLFNQIASENHCVILVHPASVEDIKRDKDKVRSNRMISKIAKYPALKNPPEPDAGFSVLLGSPTKPNDIVDDKILYALKQNCIDILVTEDLGIHSDAERCGVDDRVYSILEVRMLLEVRYKKAKIELPHVEEVQLHNISKDEEIFDSIRKEYTPFDQWFLRCQRAGREAWICRGQDKKIIAIAIYKDESKGCEFFTGNVLKICTFKVAEKYGGNKLGELMVKMIFGYCVTNKYDHAYLTVFPKHERLMTFINDFGFAETGQKTSLGELVFSKSFQRPDVSKVDGITPLTFHRLYYPYFLGSKVSKYIIPIRPQYHRELFSDYTPIQRELLITGSSPCSNAIKKAYICHAKRTLHEGDLIIFYRSHDLKCLTTLGIVEKVARTEKPDELISFVGKRTVFTQDELNDLCKKEVLVILFRQIQHLKSNPKMSWLRKTAIIKNNIESITRIDDTGFQQIVGALDGSLFADQA